MWVTPKIYIKSFTLPDLSKSSLSIFFVDDTVMFINGNTLSGLAEYLDEDLMNMEDWLRWDISPQNQIEPW